MGKVKRFHICPNCNDYAGWGGPVEGDWSKIKCSGCGHVISFDELKNLPVKEVME